MIHCKWRLSSIVHGSFKNYLNASILHGYFHFLYKQYESEQYLV